VSRFVASFVVLVGAVGCGSSSTAPPLDAGVALSDAPFEPVEAGVYKPRVDGGFPVGDAGLVLRADRFVTKVVSFTPGDCAGFGMTKMPDIVEGPPVGGGDDLGGLDVLTLGFGGEIVLSFEPNAIVDGPGPDFIVFENPFYAGGDRTKPNAELGEVSASEDGVTWKTFPCTARSFPYGSCAGWHPVYSAPDNGISPVDPKTAGGDAFDLADVGLSRARFVRVRDLGTVPCPPNPDKTNNVGFDLDAIAIVNAERP
jgi:hypothetical protein